MVVINSVSLKARVLATISHFQPSLLFSGKAGSYLNDAPYGTPPEV
jgi:hypothetical protein